MEKWQGVSSREVRGGFSEPSMKGTFMLSGPRGSLEERSRTGNSPSKGVEASTGWPCAAGRKRRPSGLEMKTGPDVAAGQMSSSSRCKLGVRLDELVLD